MIEAAPTNRPRRALVRVMERVLAFEGRDTVRSDEQAWAETVARLFDLHHPKLYRLALRLTWGDDEASDLVQDTFLRVIERGHLPPDDTGAERWLVRVLVNLCRDRARRGAVRRAHAERAAGDPPSPGADPGVDAAVRDAVRSLPFRQRAVVVLHEIEGRSLAEVAGLLGIAAVTARWHLHTALRKLREVLER